MSQRASTPRNSRQPLANREAIKEIRHAVRELISVIVDWRIWALRSNKSTPDRGRSLAAGRQIEALPTDLDNLHTPTAQVYGMSLAISLEKRAGLALRTLYGHGCVPPSLHHLRLEQALSRFPSYPRGPIDIKRDKQFVASVREMLPPLRELGAELEAWSEQLQYAPLSVIKSTDPLTATGADSTAFVSTGVEQTRPVARAIALMLDHRKRFGKLMTVADVLKHLPGIGRSTLYDDPIFKATRKAIKDGLKANVPYGFKSGGNIDAVDDGND